MVGSLRYHGLFWGGEGSGGAQLQILTSDTFGKKLKREDLNLGLYVKFKPAPIHVYPTKGFSPLFLFLHKNKNKTKRYLKICHLIPVMATLRNRIGGQWVPKGSCKVSPARSLPAFSRTAFNVNDSQRTATQPSMKAVGSLGSHSSQEP